MVWVGSERVKMVVKTSHCITGIATFHGISGFLVYPFPAVRSIRNSTPSGGGMSMESGRRFLAVHTRPSG